MRYQPTQVSLEGDELPPPAALVEEAIEYQEPENPFLDTLDETAAVEEPAQATEVIILETAADVRETADDLEDVAIAVESLEAIALHLQDLKAKNETVSVESAALLNIGFDNAVRKFPAFKASAGVESCENFAVDPAQATIVSLESIGDKIKAGYEALKKFLKDLWEKFKSFLGNIIAGAGQAEKAANANLSAAKTANTSRQASGEITIPALLNNPVLTAKAVTTLTNLVNSIGDVSYKELLEMMQRINKGETDIPMEVMMEKTHKVFDAYARMKDDAYLGNLSFDNDQFPPSIKLLEASERKAKPLTISLVRELSYENIKLCRAIAELRSTLKARSEAVARISALMEFIGNRTQLPKEEAESPTAKPDEALRMIRSILTIVSKVKAFETRILGRAVQVANAVNKVCADSIKAHG